jgi:hypothetical protein
MMYLPDFTVNTARIGSPFPSNRPIIGTINGR